MSSLLFINSIARICIRSSIGIVNWWLRLICTRLLHTEICRHDKLFAWVNRQVGKLYAARQACTCEPPDYQCRSRSLAEDKSAQTTMNCLTPRTLVSTPSIPLRVSSGKQEGTFFQRYFQ